MFSMIPTSIIVKFIIDYATKAIHAGMIALIGAGLANGDQTKVMEGGAVVALTILVNVILNAVQNKKISTNTAKVDAVTTAVVKSNIDVPPVKPK